MRRNSSTTQLPPTNPVTDRVTLHQIAGLSENISDVGGRMWIKWDGRRGFRGDTLLRVKFRNGATSKDALEAYKWRGKWGGKFPKNWDYDIVAVCIESQS